MRGAAEMVKYGGPRYRRQHYCWGALEPLAKTKTAKACCS